MKRITIAATTLLLIFGHASAQTRQQLPALPKAQPIEQEELSCEFNRYAIGCWHESGNWSGCHAIGDDGEWQCQWNKPAGTSDD